MSEVSKDPRFGETKAMLLFETPQDVLKAIEGGVDIKEVNLGSLAHSTGKVVDVYKRQSLFGSIIDNNLNQVMKCLAAITIILEFPTMISGLYCMNVNGVGMPFATKAYGFAAISIFSLIVCLIAVYILKKKHIL